ncbi:MAG: hypothetical protein AAFY78_02695 [Cyanobacteria bacterium J06648_16]
MSTVLYFLVNQVILTMHEKTENVLLTALFSSLGLLFGALYWFYSQTPAFVAQSGAAANPDRDRTLAVSDPARENPSVRDLFGRSAKLTLLGDTFSGQSLLRDSKFQRELINADIEFTYEYELDQVVRARRLGKEADLIVTTLDQYLQQQPEGKIVGLISRSAGADALVLNTRDYPELTSMRQLAQLIKTTAADEYQLSFAYAGDSPSEYMAAALEVRHPELNLSQLRPQRYQDASEVWQALQTADSSPVAVMLRDPYVTRAVDRGYTVAVSSETLPDTIISVVVASDRILEKNPQAVSVFLEVYYRHIDNDVRDADKLQALVARDGSIEAEAGATVLDHIDFFTALEAQSWLIDGRLDEHIRKTAALLSMSGHINRTPRNLDSLMDAQVIELAAHNTQVLVELVETENPELADRFKGLGSTVQTR